MPLLSRTVLAAALASLAAAAPAQAAVSDTTLVVCNQATPVSLGGIYETDGLDPLPPARFTENLYVKPGNGKGLVHAASRSHALQVCEEAGADTITIDEDPEIDPGTGTGGSGDDGTAGGGGLNT